MSSLAGTSGDGNHPFASTLGRPQPMTNGHAVGTMLPLGINFFTSFLKFGKIIQL